MGKKKNKKKPEIYQMWALCIFCMGIFTGALTWITGSSLWLHMRMVLFGLFGNVAFLFPCSLIYIATIMAKEKKVKIIHTKIIFIFCIYLLLGAMVQMSTQGEILANDFFGKVSNIYFNGTTFQGAGAFSALLSVPLEAAMGKVGGMVVASILLFLFLMLFFGKNLIDFLATLQKPADRVGEMYAEKAQQVKIKKIEKENQKIMKKEVDIDLGPTSVPKSSIDIDLGLEESPEIPLEDRGEQASAPKEDMEEITQLLPQGQEDTVEEVESLEPIKTVNMEVPCPEKKEKKTTYQYPPLNLLKVGSKQQNKNLNQELKDNAERLILTLKNFGVKAKMMEISRGPAVTRYELQPDVGVKISKITGLADDIALSLAAAGIRIEAPIPNKPAIGIEVPNKTIDIVKAKEIIASKVFADAESKLSVALGKDISGNITVVDLAKMPHLLVAGATGSGKSVCINTIITSLLYKASPEEVRLLMIDPKVVELGIYNGIPHLLVPVVTDAKKASGALGWAVGEMLKRYRLFADANVRDLKGYNQLAKQREDLTFLPQIVIIIDELADLMMASPREVEDAICRLAQMARAAGMHLIIATQRPSVDVITGTIKANIPSRIAFSVSSQVDSRTILDGAGAEKLLGRGDMLYYPVGASKPTRVQGCFIEDEEVEKIVAFIKESTQSIYDEGVLEEIEKQASIGTGAGKTEELGEESQDPMMDKAIEIAVELGQISTSQLQRKLRLGYARAARIIDELEERGLISAMDGSKPRQVLLSREQWIEMTVNKEK